MVQMRGSSNNYEHEFSGIREVNNKLTALDTQQCVLRRTCTTTSTFNTLSKSNTSGDKDMCTNEITATLNRK